jgi:hypothetical protein
MKNKNIIIVISVGIILVIVSFYTGTRFGVNKNSAQLRPGGQFINNSQRNGPGGMNTRGNLGGAVSGDILSKDANSITLKMRDGSSMIVFVATSTQVMKSTSGTATDLIIGEQVVVMGQPNLDGSVNAQSIQIRPTMSTTTQK